MTDQIRIPPVCMFCRMPEDMAPEQFHYPTKAGRVLTRVQWTGLDAQGRPVIAWEDMAGQVPSQVQFPGVHFIPQKAWCPICLVEYHVGPQHPTEDKDQEGPKLVVVP